MSDSERLAWAVLTVVIEVQVIKGMRRIIDNSFAQRAVLAMRQDK